MNRAAEAMTIFAVMCAGIYPVIHVGRVWFAWWLFPMPNSNSIWPQFRSPLMWDVFAVSTYFTVSLLFWYVGLVPDLAMLRDRAKTKVAAVPLRPVRAGLDRVEPPLEQLREGLSDPGRPRDAAGAVGALASCRWTSRCRSCRAGTRRSSRRTSSRARSSPGSAWC